MPDLADWRERLREAIQRSGKKHYLIAEDAGVTRATLSRILTGAHSQPKFETILRIAHAAGENVGYLAGERGFSLSSEQRVRVQAAAVILIDLTRHYPL
ncbi:MAG TPA: helix-turn-helix transcriptional regulator [Thermoanaerobaculia bacterium]|jgi:transcriptional regulator with XRE-family HTH domain|nr:helix-turn-helix transcriptional regulator [Thermoanaerobaculia bacterium]